MNLFSILKNKKIFIYFIGLLLVFSCNSNRDKVPDETPAIVDMEVEVEVEVEVIVKSAIELGPIKTPENVLTRDAGVSAKIGNSILWLFGDTLFNPASVEGDNLHSNTAAIAPADDPTEALEPTDTNGAPFQAIPFNNDENAYNEGTNSPNERIALWPGGAMPVTNGVLAFVLKLYVNPGLLNYEHIGVEMADFSTGETTAVRSNTLFEKEDPVFLSPLVQDGFVYLYGLLKINGSQAIGVARAPEEKVRERGAYETWNGSAWDADLTQAATLFSNVPGAVSVSWNSHLNTFIAIHSLVLSNKIVMRTSKTPEGNWSDPITLFEGKVPLEGTNYAGEQHAVLAEQNGKVIYVSYYHPKAEFFQGELRLVKVEFE